MSAPATSRRKCLNIPDSFCYICGSFTIPSQRANINAFVKQAYFAFFKVNSVIKTSYGPLTKCASSVSRVYGCGQKEREKLAFGIPWFRESKKINCTDCYFCLVKTSRFNKKNKSKI